MMTRRLLLTSGVAGLAAIYGSRWWAAAGRADETFAVSHTDDEGHKLLTPEQYAVLREGATQQPFTSALLNAHRRGNVRCAGCHHVLCREVIEVESATVE